MHILITANEKKRFVDYQSFQDIQAYFTIVSSWLALHDFSFFEVITDNIILLYIAHISAVVLKCMHTKSRLFSSTRVRTVSLYLLESAHLSWLWIQNHQTTKQSGQFWQPAAVASSELAEMSLWCHYCKHLFGLMGIMFSGGTPPEELDRPAHCFLGNRALIIYQRFYCKYLMCCPILMMKSKCGLVWTGSERTLKVREIWESTTVSHLSCVKSSQGSVVKYLNVCFAQIFNGSLDMCMWI